MILQNIAIVGAGTQGSMLAYRCAVHGRRVVLCDVSETSIRRATEKIRGWADERTLAAGFSDFDVEAILGRISFERDLAAALADADLVIENVPEILELKRQVWNAVDASAPDKTLLTTNSSSLKSSDIGKDVRRKAKTFNLNFMTPTKDDLVEVMWNAETAEETKTAIIAFLKAQGNVPIITRKEIKGFSLNRVWRAMKKECLKLWSGGYISPDDLDRAFILEWGTEYGPFALMDKVGLDVVRRIELTYHAESGDPADVPPKALDDMIEKGLLGEKSGEGFYKYPHPAYEDPDWLRFGAVGTDKEE
jgi:3-hydroxybutyryl-CoA dehydrogenase